MNADAIRAAITHSRQRVLATGEHPSYCKGCAAERELEALLDVAEAAREAIDKTSMIYPAGGLDALEAALTRVAGEQ